MDQSFLEKQFSMTKSFLDSCRNAFTDSEYNTWLLPLQFEEKNNTLIILAPNQFAVDWLKENLSRTKNERFLSSIQIKIGSRLPPLRSDARAGAPRSRPYFKFNPKFSFENFIEGKGNRLAKAGAHQVSANPGGAYNPLFIYGGVGLGKTHLMQAIGNAISSRNPKLKIAYLNSERFVSDMVRGLQHNKINEFKNLFRNLDVLLIDDIQFFANKERSQEEFFHTFNALIEDQKQMVFSCDKYPKDVQGLEERLKSRFGWGLTVAIDPPDLETSAAILMSKANELGFKINDEIALLIATHVKSNIRELEGALRRLIAYSKITREKIDVSFAKTALGDLFAAHDRSISSQLIQNKVAEYYKIRVADLSNKTRSRSIARPRQMAMYLCRELTKLSLPEIGHCFGGRDHTTVIHACNKISSLISSDRRFEEDHNNLYRTLTN